MNEAKRFELRRKEEMEERASLFVASMAERLRAVRTAKGMSQDELAFLATLSRSHIGSIERGKLEPRLSTLYKIAAALEIEVWELLRPE